MARAVAEAGIKECSQLAEAGIKECSRLEKEEEEKADAGGRGRGRAVAAVNNSAPGPHGPNLTDAQFDKWLLTQRP